MSDLSVSSVNTSELSTAIIVPGSTEHIKLIEDSLRILIEPGSVVELRVPNFQKAEDYTTTVAGFYDYENLDLLAATASLLSGHAPGIYYTINPVTPGQLAVCANNYKMAVSKGGLTTDEQITHRHILPLDIDPARRDGTITLNNKISTTNEEKARAYTVAREIVSNLTELGWPLPIIADSGNGYYVLYRINLPTNDDHLVENCIRALAQQHSTALVSIDERCFNPSRVMKIPYTLASKGTSTAERPHRLSRIIDAPPHWDIVPTSLLQALAVSCKGPQHPAPPVTTRAGTLANAEDSYDLDTTVARARAYIAKMDPSKDGQNGHARLYKVAMVLMNDFALPRDQAMVLFKEYNARPDCDPESEAQLEHKLDSADKAILIQGGPTGSKVHSQFHPATNQNPADPTYIARVLLENSLCDQSGVPVVAHFNNDFWVYVGPEYDGPVWRRSPEWPHGCLLALLNEYEDQRYSQAVAAWAGEGRVPKRMNTSIKLSQVRVQLRSLLGLDEYKMPGRPFWISSHPGDPNPDTIIALRNGLLDVSDPVHPQLIPHSPRYFTPCILPFDYDPAARPSLWLRAPLAYQWANDPDSIVLLQDWFGYCVCPDTRYQKMLVLHGRWRWQGSNYTRAADAVGHEQLR